MNVFSIDPKTGKPFISVDEVYEKINMHVFTTCRYLLIHYSLEDLRQQVITEVCAKEYKPELANASTFTNLVINSAFGRIIIPSFKGKRLFDKNLIRFNAIVGGIDGEGAEDDDKAYHSINPNFQDNVTPIDVLLAKEVVEDFNEEIKLKKKLGVGGSTSVPEAWVPKRNYTLKSKKRKKCVTCKKRKLVDTQFYKKMMNGLLTLYPYCKVCHTKRSERNRIKRNKLKKTVRKSKSK